MERIIERFDMYMNANRLNDNKVTNLLALSNGLIGKCRIEGRDMSKGLVARVLNVFTDLSREWLLFGEGKMLKEKGDMIKAKETVINEKTFKTKDIQKENEFLKQKLELMEELRKQDKELNEYLKVRLMELELKDKKVS